MYGVLVGILILDSLVLTTAILLQAGQGGGLASLGSGAGTETFMGGRQATTLLHKVTWWTAGTFLFLSLVLALISAQSGAPRSVLDTGAPAPAPVQPAPLPLQPTPEQPQGTPARPPAAPATPARPPQPSGQRPPDR